MDLRREHRAWQKHYRRHEWLNRDTGIEWYTYDDVDSTKHPVYDSGPSRIWTGPIHVPYLWIHKTEGTDTTQDIGLEIYADIQVLISRDVWDSVGFTNPEIRHRLSDLFKWEATLYSVVALEPQARMILGSDNSIVVYANEAKMDEFYQDVITGVINSTT